MTTPRFLILPGWPEPTAAQWCALWQAMLPDAEPVPQDDAWWPRRGDWMAQLEERVLAGAPGADATAARLHLTAGPVEGQLGRAGARATARPIVLVAHHLGCHLVARWAAHSGHADRVLAALLVAPVDIERPDLPPQLQAWAPIQRQPLPFASTVLPGGPCTLAEADRMADMARSWGSTWDGTGSGTWGSTWGSTWGGDSGRGSGRGQTSGRRPAAQAEPALPSPSGHGTPAPWTEAGAALQALCRRAGLAAN